MGYDIIGDVHGCYNELIDLVEKMGYKYREGIYHHEGRILVFLGDLADRGYNSIKVIEFVYKHVREKKALYVPGNHCDKLYRFFIGHDVQITHGLETTVAELRALSTEERRIISTHFIELYENAPLYLLLDNGRLIVAHAGIPEKYVGRYDKKVKRFVLYGDITGEVNPDGTPARRNWAADYKGEAFVVYGHTPVKEPYFINNTANIDTGCVFGGKLTALRYPEKEIVSVKSTLSFDKDKFRENM
ncbi:bis(5'-nucleosyl)-tetraphosphatase PrpE [Aceticella autotrophica]|uniref:Bis(5'-nucleosyl)-tetraphosphatase PrpE n=1 Tax=Aceticella autotrophica TaxID=2755338 RepID=A0A975AV21_9THEO|nr:bis(5'-nucleosyl)-tetraphosphatase PrpE [Aceticella autotrophica]QSZ27000.1 bis(5'-nucleosyl)-tetraphosphatase PrpE [Aceticella autotrophica]